MAKTCSSSRKKDAAIGKEQMLAMYRTMLTIRRTEEQLAKLYSAGKIYGGVHTHIGEEAAATGVCAHLRNDDTVFSTHRGHGHALSKGIPPRELIAELLGRSTGCGAGRGGGMHLFKPEIGFMGSSGIVDWTLLSGSGSSGRILERDVRRAASAPADRPAPVPGDRSACPGGRHVLRGHQADLRGSATDRGKDVGTVTNLGMYEIDSFTPIINLPECAILGVGRIVAKQVVTDADAGRLSIRRMVVLSLTFDHRLVDGAPAARFLQKIKMNVEKPYLWLAGP